MLTKDYIVTIKDNGIQARVVCPITIPNNNDKEFYYLIDIKDSFEHYIRSLDELIV